MESLNNIRWYHVAIICLIAIIVFLIVMDNGSTNSSCANAVKPIENFGTQKQNDKHDKHELILYHAAFCGYCKQFMPEWDQFATYAKDNISNLKVTKLQCDGNDKAICDKANVSGFPTVVMKLANGKEVPFDGNRTKSSLIDFCKKTM